MLWRDHRDSGQKERAFIYEHADNVTGKDKVTGCLVLERCKAMKSFTFYCV